MNILSSLEQNILVFVKISVVLKMLYSRSDFYFLWRFMCAGVYHCHCIQRSVKDVHLELCALGYYCIRMKYWTIFKKKKGKWKMQRQEKKNWMKVEIFLPVPALSMLDVSAFFSRKCDSVWSAEKRCFEESLQTGSTFIYSHFTLTHYISSWGSPGYT